MKRTTRKRALLNVCLLVLAVLALIVWLGPGGDGDAAVGSFAWTTIRYQTRARKLPKADGRCPGVKDSDRPALVVSRVATDGDISWIDKLVKKYHLCVYQVDALPDPKHPYLQVPANRGHEAMAYLTFLIDNYEDIPEAGAVFVRGSRWAWHHDHPEYDNAALLRTLNASAALKQAGYHNLRCDWSASTCEATNVPPQARANGNSPAPAAQEPWSLRVAHDGALPRAIQALFGDDDDVRLGRNHIIRSQCCAQFVVARENVWSHSKDEYIALRQWLLDEGGAPRDNRVAARVLSYMWHVLFIPNRSDGPGAREGLNTRVHLSILNKMACPSAEACYCRLYGRCELEGCTQGRCRGQYHVPPDFRLPSSWAATHS